MQKAEDLLPPVQHLLTTKQTAAYLGLSHDSVRRLVYVGELPVVKLVVGAKGWRFHKKDLDACIERAKIVF